MKHVEGLIFENMLPFLFSLGTNELVDSLTQVWFSKNWHQDSDYCSFIERNENTKVIFIWFDQPLNFYETSDWKFLLHRLNKPPVTASAIICLFLFDSKNKWFLLKIEKCSVLMLQSLCITVQAKFSCNWLSHFCVLFARKNSKTGGSELLT